MFGTLVVIFPAPHEGGTLVFRHLGEEWTFDSSTVLSAAGPASIAYAAFFSDVEHEVLPVTSGHRITLTYKLYFVYDKRASAKDLVSEPPPLPQEEIQWKFRSGFEAILKDPEFLPGGGTVGFGMRHVYPIKARHDGLQHIYGLLKDSDATVYQSLRALGLEPILYLNYRHEGDNVHSESVMINKVPNLDSFRLVDDLFGLLQDLNGTMIPSDEQVTWVTPETTFSSLRSAYATSAFGDFGYVGYAYGVVCLIVRIGNMDNRLANVGATQGKKQTCRGKV
jgi:hypothetical protein